MVRIGSLFSGIGGLDLGVEAHTGGRAVFAVEQTPYAAAVYRKRWPGVPIFDDVRQVGAHNLPPCDWLIGGSPCQDLSSAGRQAGLVEGDRSALFFELVRIAAEMRPDVVIVENVPGLLRWRGVVESSFAAEGYGVTWALMRASHAGAQHLRKRVFVYARRGGRHLGICDPGPVPDVQRWPTPRALESHEDVEKWRAGSICTCPLALLSSSGGLRPVQ